MPRAATARTGVRLAFLLPGGLALLAGLDAALLLLGLPAPVTTDRLPDVHGQLMTLGFVGTVVALERAVALGRLWGYGAPVGLGLGGLLLLTPAPVQVGESVTLAGTLVLLGLYRAFWSRQPAAAVAVQALGAVLATGAALLLLGGTPVPATTPWLAGFLVLTIAGERVELARIGFLTTRAEHTALACALAVVAAVVAALLWPQTGYVLLGAALLALVGVLVLHDVARRTVRSSGLPRYMAACMLAGYAWLALAAGVWLVRGPVPAGPGYDAVLHAVFLGFVMSMVMAHAPVILPAVLRRPLPYRPTLYAPVVLLHASLAVRVLVGDARDLPVVVQVAGVANVVALLGFVALAATQVLRGAPAPAPRPARPVAVPA